MALIDKHPTDRFLSEMVTHFYWEAYEYEGHLTDSPDEWVKMRIDETGLHQDDKERAYKHVGKLGF